MARLTFVDAAGAAASVDYAAGGSVMEAAVERDVAGIEAQCYGAGVCGTCHVYVEAAWQAATGAASAWERDMLDGLSLARPDSRLACQIRVTDALDGAIFHIPAAQESVE